MRSSTDSRLLRDTFFKPWRPARHVCGMITTSSCRWRTGLMRGQEHLLPPVWMQCFMEERFGDTAKDEKLLQEGSVQELRLPSVFVIAPLRRAAQGFWCLGSSWLSTS